MKQTLLISQSKLAHNLFKTVAASIPVMLECTENPEDANLLPKTGRLFSTIVFDWQALEGKNLDDVLEPFKKHRRLQEAVKILIHPRDKNIPQDKLKRLGITRFHAKPFLTEEIVKILL